MGEMTLLAVLAVGAGGFLGGVARHLLALWPGGLLGTFAANSLAVIVFGAAMGLSGVTALAVGAGFAAALSTWSTLAREIGQLLKERRFRLLTGYTTATLTAGLAMAWLLSGLPT